MFGGGDGAGGALTGPVQAWEIPVGGDLVADLELGEALMLPYQPRAVHEIPADAVEALTELAGIATAADLLVLPAAVRPTDVGCAYVPTQVLGVGVRGVALWVDDLPHPRVVAVIAHGEIAVVEHELTLRYGRLTVLGVHHRITLPYRSGGWSAMRELLTRLRARMLRQPTLPSPADRASRSVTWGRVAHSPLVTLGNADPEVWVSVTSARRARWPAAQAVLTGREFVLVGDVTARLPLAHGVDLLAVPRARMTGLRGRDSRLTIVAAGLTRHVDVGPRLVEAVMVKLAPRLVPASRPATRPVTPAAPPPPPVRPT